MLLDVEAFRWKLVTNGNTFTLRGGEDAAAKGVWMELGMLIRKHRAETHMSQEELASAIFVSRQTVSNWECDKTYPDVQSLLLMSNLFGVSIDELVKGDMEMIQEQAGKDARAMKVLGWVMIAFVLFSITIPVWGYFDWGWDAVPSVIIFALGFGIAMAASIAIEVIKKRHNVASFREIDDFMKGRIAQGGANPDAFARKHKVSFNLLEALAGAAIAIVLMPLIAWVGWFIGTL